MWLGTQAVAGWIQQLVCVVLILPVRHQREYKESSEHGRIY